MADTSKRGTGSDFDPDYPLLGETLGLWKLVKGVGRGGMGEVYAAEYDYLHLLTLRSKPEERLVIRRELAVLPRSEQARLASEMLGTPLPADARFAIKVCTARSGTAGHRRFLQEAELAQRLGDHPYIVSVHAVNRGQETTPGEVPRPAGDLPLETGKYKDVAFMVMDLATRDYDHTKVTIPQAVHIVRCIATALDHAHQSGIVHRDLKPENILGSVESPLLTDFGIAKEMDQSLGLTRTGQIIGTLDYMSPEQATDAKNVDHRSDIYSLGVVLYEMSTGGHLPYVHLAEREACLAAIRAERVEPRWPRAYVPAYPRGLQRIVLKAMAHRPGDRYQEMSDFIRDLDRFTRGGYISPLGRVGMRRWLRWQYQAHPRLVWTLGMSTLLTLTVWAAISVPPLFDANRHRIVSRLDLLSQTVTRIGEEKQAGTCRIQQLDEAARKTFVEELGQDLQRHAGRYPALEKDYQDLLRRLAQEQYLVAQFRGPGDTQFALQQLMLAGSVKSPQWKLALTGLKIEETSEITLGPYTGDGLYVHLAFSLPVQGDFSATIRERRNPRFVTTLQSQRDGAESTLVLSLSRDQKPPEILGRGTWVPEAMTTVWLHPQVRRLEAYLPRVDDPNNHLQITSSEPALAPHEGEGTPAELVLRLPRGSLLLRIEVYSDECQPRR